MNKQDRETWARYYQATARVKLNMTEAEQLRRDAQRLHRWSEAECNGEIERDENTGKTYRNYNINGPGPVKKYPIADKETPATERIKAICKKHRIMVEFQGDPRGWPVNLKKGSFEFSIPVGI